MAILDAPTYAFDQRLFNLYNPAFPGFTGDVQAKWVGKVTELNTQIANNSNSHFMVGQTVDAYGEHGYLFIS